MVQDAVAVIPDDSSVEIQEANKSSSAEIFEKLIDKMNAEISKAILGQTLTTEIGASGSYAASNTHFAVRQDIIDSDRKLVEKTINQLLQWIYEINFTNQDAPVFEMYQEEDVDLTLAQRDKIISECGVKFTKEYFIKAFGYDAEDFDIHAEFQGSTPFCQEILAGCIHHSKPRTARQECCKIIENAPSDSQFSQFKEEPEIEGQIQIDELFKFLSETELSIQAQKMLNPLISLLENCESFEEAKELLTDKNLKSKQFEQSLQKALFLCELQGRSDGLDE